MALHLSLARSVALHGTEGQIMQLNQELLKSWQGPACFCSAQLQPMLLLLSMPKS